MSTAAPIRPLQALRQRRETQRPSQLRSSTRIAHNEADSAVTADKVMEKPYVITEDYILKKFRGNSPSLIIHLHQHHFRFEHQDGNFPYNSPMKALIQHLRDGTVPHFMLEEMLKAGVQFYDGCLIVQIVNHRVADVKPPTGAQIANQKKDNMIPGSIHNWNDHLTPSPFVPYPSPPTANSTKIEKRPSSSGSQPCKEKKEASQDIAKAGPKSPQISVKVLFPTQLSRHTEIELLATTPMPDLNSRRQQARTAQTPMSAHPPTPITSVPPTPSLGRPAKRQRMILDESNIHAFEAEVINSTAPALYLEPSHSLAETVDLIEATTHPMNKNPPPAPKTRKRTTAELAADEAQFNADQNFMLFGDNSAPATASGQMNGDGEGLRGGAATFEPRFSRFKTLENIKIQHEEAERLKKEEEARQAQLKREQQQAVEARQREREAANQHQQQAEHNRLMAQQQEQQRQHALQQQEQVRRAQAAAAQASGNMMGSQQHPMQLSQPPQNSPMVRHQTPMQASPVINANAVATHAMGGVPMAPTSSSQAGSPPRPPSALPHSAGAQHMARQMSRQQSSQHPGSAHGTPQMVQGTPQMGQAVPVTRHMTPQPGRVNQHGSPMGMQGTPVMMNGTPQLPNGMTHEQFARLQQMRRMQQQNAMANGGSPQNVTHEQLQILRQQHMAQMQAQNQMAQAQNHGGQNSAPTSYNIQLQQQMRSQMSQVAGATPNGVQQRPPNQANPMMANPAMQMTAQQQELRAKQQRERIIMKMVQHFGGAPNVPPQIQQLIQQGGNQGIMRAWQMVLSQIQQQQQAQQNQGQQHNMNQPNGGGGQGMNMGGMGNMGQMNMGGMNMNGMATSGAAVAAGQGGPQGNTAAGMNGNMNMAQQLELMRRMQFQQQQQQAAQAVAHQQQAQQQAQNGGGGGGGQGPGGGPPNGVPGGATTPDQQQAQQQYMARLIRQQQMLAQRNQAQQQQQQQGQQGHPQQQMMGQMGGMGGMWQGGMGRPGQPGNGMG